MNVTLSPPPKKTEEGEINLESLKEFILWAAEGMDHTYILFLDDCNSFPYGFTSRHEIDMDDLDSQVELLLEAMDYFHAGLCFYPNGALLDKEVTKIKFHLIDIDKGTKEEQLERIALAPIPPTVVYEGRAGHKLLYQISEAFWNNSNSVTIQQSIEHFKNVQNQLITFFNGDTAVCNPANAFRLPFVNNYKNWPKEVYTERIIEFNPENIYTQKEIRDAFPSVNDSIIDVNSRSLKEMDRPRFENEKTKEIVETFKNYLVMQGCTVIETPQKLSFNCPVHSDSRPSAFMYKDSLWVNCSAGKKDENKCPIGHGKPLRWLAEKMGWHDLVDLLEDMQGAGASAYNGIHLNSMTPRRIVPMVKDYGEMNELANEIMNNFCLIMNGQNTDVNPTQREWLKSLSYYALGFYDYPLVATLPPGWGKTTWIKSLARTLLDLDYTEAGMVIAVERIESAKKLAEDIGEYIVPGQEETKSAAIVLENASSSDVCDMKLSEYTYGICKICDKIRECPIAQQYQRQKESPIVIITHKRLSMESENLDKYLYWRDGTGQKKRRNMLIIDEKPPLDAIYTLTIDEVLEFEYKLNAWASNFPSVIRALEMIQKIKDCFTVRESQGIIEPIDEKGQFDFKAIWYRNYLGRNPELIEKVEALIVGGGYWNVYNDKVTVTVGRRNPYNFDSYNTIILDGTALYDVDYRRTNFVYMESPPVLIYYRNVSLNVAYAALGKSNLNQHRDYLKYLAADISRISQDKKALVLCSMEFEDEITSLLQTEVEGGNVKINHYGNIKGSNDYNECQAIFLIGIEHKGDPYYHLKHSLYYGNLFPTNAVTSNNVRRYELEIERFKLSDQVVALLQNIYRTALRNWDGAQVDIYLTTKDKIMTKLLEEYFFGCRVYNWTPEVVAQVPDWYWQLDELFAGLQWGEPISKKEIRGFLGLVEEKGERKFQRIQRGDVFKRLALRHCISPLDDYYYIKQLPETTDDGFYMEHLPPDYFISA